MPTTRSPPHIVGELDAHGHRQIDVRANDRPAFSAPAAILSKNTDAVSVKNEFPDPTVGHLSREFQVRRAEQDSEVR